jgi:iron complex outermembrane receptor protein
MKNRRMKVRTLSALALFSAITFAYADENTLVLQQDPTVVAEAPAQAPSEPGVFKKFFSKIKDAVTPKKEEAKVEEAAVTAPLVVADAGTPIDPSIIETTAEVKKEATPSTGARINLAPTVVTATRMPVNSFDVPVSIDVVEKENISGQGQWAQLLSEPLERVPGISAGNRGGNMAQDVAIQSRGYGARSLFGMRGIRLNVDGFNLTNPDGISNPSNVDLSNVETIEVMRGPFSALYGSSSGGVISLRTKKAPDVTAQVSTNYSVGSYGAHSESVEATGTVKGVQYLLNTQEYKSDGYREHSAVDKKQTTAKIKFSPRAGTDVTLLALYNKIDAQDPLAMKRVGTSVTNTAGTFVEPSVFENPRGSATVATLDNTGKLVENKQLGIAIDHMINDDNLIRVSTVFGERTNSQNLSVSSTSLSSRNSSIARDFYTNEVSWTHGGSIFTKPYKITTGLTYGSVEDKRLDVNGTGTAFTGTVNRDETQKATNFDQFAQGQISILPNVDLHAGARHTEVKYEIQSNINTNSGNLKFDKTVPVAGIIWKATPNLNLYANYGKGFETPVLLELQNTANPTTGAGTSAGPNLALKPSVSDNYEMGAKAFIGANTKVTAAVFQTNTTNEIVNVANGTFPVYNNAGKTSRKGFEATLDSALPYNFNIYGAYTYLDAKFDSDFTPVAGTLVAAGNRMPGSYKSQAFGELAWKYPAFGFTAAVNGKYYSDVMVNDTNLDKADSYTIFGARAGFTQDIKGWKISEYGRVDNITNNDYIASVRINDTNSRAFEPGLPRNYTLGLSASYSFK